jgi:NAD(P)-dependent dehydrogenase (short-subunit alcohol dehydrogenase family)
MAQLQGRVAVVTGGASGIGLACVELLAARGATVVVADRDLAGAERAAQACGGRAYAVDVGVEGALEKLAELVERQVGPVQMLVNAAGIIQGPMLRPEEIAQDSFERLFRINLMGTHAACTAFGSRMAKRRSGSILNLASIAGMRSTPLHVYGPLKAAVIRLTENLATEWGRSGVRVNCLSPGPVLTPALQQAIDDGQRDRVRMEGSTASGRIVAPLAVAQAAAFLLSDEAGAITGVNLPVDHGWLVANSWASFGGVREAS